MYHRVIISKKLKLSNLKCSERQYYYTLFKNIIIFIFLAIIWIDCFLFNCEFIQQFFILSYCFLYLFYYVFQIACYYCVFVIQNSSICLKLSALFNYQSHNSSVFINTRKLIHNKLTMLESQYSSRRDILHSSIRKEAIRNQIKQVRQDLLSQQKNSLLDSIINDGLQNNQQLNTLIYFANQDQSNAIIYLGNLLIDGALTPEIITSRIHPSKNDYWCWLIRVLYSCRYCEIAHIQYILDKIQSKKTAPSQQFSHYKSMNSVYSTIQCLGFIEILLHDQEKDMINIMLSKGDLVKSLLNLTTHQRKQIYSSSIRIINKIIGFDSYSAQTFINEYLQKCPTVCGDQNIPKKIQTSLKMKNLAKYIQKIFLKADPKLRAIGYQIMTNLCLNGVVFVELSKTPFIIYQKQKQIVKIEISYYFLELVKNCSDEDLRMLLDNSFAAVLKNIYLQEKTKQIKTNIYESLLILNARVRKMCLEGNGQHMWKIIQRLCLDSLFKQRTMEEE